MHLGLPQNLTLLSLPNHNSKLPGKFLCSVQFLPFCRFLPQIHLIAVHNFLRSDQFGNVANPSPTSLPGFTVPQFLMLVSISRHCIFATLRHSRHIFRDIAYPPPPTNPPHCRVHYSPEPRAQSGQVHITPAGPNAVYVNFALTRFSIIY